VYGQTALNSTEHRAVLQILAPDRFSEIREICSSGLRSESGEAATGTGMIAAPQYCTRRRIGTERQLRRRITRS
jgi:hypothetical protein